jgi:hypothetical protein
MISRLLLEVQTLICQRRQHFRLPQNSLYIIHACKLQLSLVVRGIHAGLFFLRVIFLRWLQYSTGLSIPYIIHETSVALSLKVDLKHVYDGYILQFSDGLPYLYGR